MNQELIDHFRNFEFILIDDEFGDTIYFTIKELVNEETFPHQTQVHRTPEERLALIEALILDLTEIKNKK